MKNSIDGEYLKNLAVPSRITHSPEGEIRLKGMVGSLREETEYRTKPMMNISNRPIPWHIMKLYIYYSFNDFILNLGYKGNIIIEYFCNYEIFNIDFLRILEVPRFYIERLYKYE